MSQDYTSQSTNAAVEGQYDDYLMPIWKELNVPIQHAKGCKVQDFDGNEYLDVFSGISVTNVGHRNEAVVEATKAQLDKFVHGCSYLHPHETAAKLGEKLASVTPGDLKKSFFCNSGTEAVEGAIKLARKYTGNTEILALEMSFHGRTLGSLALTGNKSYKAGMAPTINDVAHTAPPYAYRCSQCDDNACSSDCATSIKRVIDTRTADDLAAIVVEPVMGEGGIIVPPNGWLSQVQDIAHERGALLIADEVQTGYGRTGEMWAVDHFDVQPDILTQAKGIANGMPLGAFTAREEIADAFEAGDHLSTFGGNPVACAAALATIEELQNGIVDSARKRGEWLSDRIGDMAHEYDVVGDVRGLGMMQGIELIDPTETGPNDVAPAPDAKLAKHVGKSLRRQGIIIGVGGFYSNVLRFQPPLTITNNQLEEAVGAIESTLDDWDGH